MTIQNSPDPEELLKFKEKVSETLEYVNFVK